MWHVSNSHSCCAAVVHTEREHEQSVCGGGHAQPGRRSVIPVFNLCLTPLDLVLLGTGPVHIAQPQRYLSPASRTHAPHSLPYRAFPTTRTLLRLINSTSRARLSNYTHPAHHHHHLPPLAGSCRGWETYMSRQTAVGGGSMVGWASRITIIDPEAGANWLSPVCLRYCVPLMHRCHCTLTRTRTMNMCAHTFLQG